LGAGGILLVFEGGGGGGEAMQPASLPFLTGGGGAVGCARPQAPAHARLRTVSRVGGGRRQLLLFPLPFVGTAPPPDATTSDTRASVPLPAATWCR